jgi:hypothetical protein
VLVRPYRDWRLWAVRVGLAKVCVWGQLEHPPVQTWVTLTFDTYTRPHSSGEWTRAYSRDVLVNMNIANVFDVHGGSTRVLVSGDAPLSSLNTADMYVQLHNETSLRTGVALNGEYEYSMYKLGWLRFNDGGNDAKWSVRNGKRNASAARH